MLQSIFKLFTVTVFVAISNNCLAAMKHDILSLGKSVYLLRPNHPIFGNPSTIISVGNDGVFIIDPGPMDLVDGVIEAIRELSSEEIRYVTTTHHHGDHSEGLLKFSELLGTISTPPQVELLRNKRVFFNGNSLSAEAVPKIVFNENLELFFNGEVIKLIQLPIHNSHTSGDILVYFQSSKILATGDLIFHNGFPIIDIGNGGSISGYMQALDYMIDNFPSDTKFVPGHSTLRPTNPETYNQSQVKEYRAALEGSINHIVTKLKDGKSIQEITREGLPKKFRWLSENYIYVNEERWIHFVAREYKEN